MAASLTLIDQMALYGIVPALFGMGALVTSTYMSAKALQVPLWYSKQVTRISVVSLFIYLILGYLTFEREVKMNDNMAVMRNIQKELDQDREKMSEINPKER